MKKNPQPTYLTFNKKNYTWKASINYRKHPELYKIGKGEQGVLICQPYKSEIGKYWRFKTPEIATISSQTILKLFRSYLKIKDFVGADLARKYLQMGFTRAKRYANYKGGIKYDKENNYTLMKKGTGDQEKLESAQIFHHAWQKAESSPMYQKMKLAWKKKYG